MGQNTCHHHYSIAVCQHLGDNNLLIIQRTAITASIHHPAVTDQARVRFLVSVQCFAERLYAVQPQSTIVNDSRIVDLFLTRRSLYGRPINLESTDCFTNQQQASKLPSSEPVPRNNRSRSDRQGIDSSSLSSGTLTKVLY